MSIPATIPTRLGPYEIVSSIGKGGMGEVWKARDPRLGRDVAIKISAAQFTDRFEREARAIAALNHPNICTLFDVGPNYLVMELVEGPTLAERILQGPIPLEEALAIAKQIADALEAAHEKNIIHRDLKPANIKIRPDGSVKVLDFGLAKAANEAVEYGPDSPTMLSVAGMILGTAGYMSPEQARGQAVDKRADIWAFGVVLYEMVTAKPLFDGATITDSLAAVLTREPDLTLAPEKTRLLLRRCLEKDPKRRLRDIGDAMAMLVDTGTSATAPSRSRLGMAAWVAAGLFAMVAVVLAFVHFREVVPIQQALYSSITLPENSSTDAGFLALSPDGRRLVVTLISGGKAQLYLRSLDSPQFVPLLNTEGARTPFWSPDSRIIGFVADGKLKTIPAAGGPVQSLCDAGLGSGGTWNGAGVILFGTNPAGPIMRVNASGGPCISVTKTESGSVHRVPEFLPDGNHFLYIVYTAEARPDVYLAALDNPNGRLLLTDAQEVTWTPPPPGGRYSHLLFVRHGALMAQPFNDRKLQLAGDAFPAGAQAFVYTGPNRHNASASVNGILAYINNPSREGQLVWLDRTGKEVEKMGSRHDQAGMALSPDGKTVATARNDPGGFGVWLYNFVRDSESRIAERGSAPVWSPDGRSLIYSSGKDLYLRDASGSNPEVPVLQNANVKFPSDWSRDGRFILYTENDPKTQGDIWYLADPLGKAGGGRPVKFLGTSAIESQAQFSPDGHWVAYYSNESGKGDVYIRSFPSGQGLSKVSTNGGSEPRWSTDGKEIYYLESASPGVQVMTATVLHGREDALEVGVPRKLFEFRTRPIIPQNNWFVYSPGADGRFLVNAVANTTAPTITVLSNWLKLATSTKEQ